MCNHPQYLIREYSIIPKRNVMLITNHTLVFFLAPSNQKSTTSQNGFAYFGHFT